MPPDRHVKRKLKKKGFGLSTCQALAVVRAMELPHREFFFGLDMYFPRIVISFT
jgi:hypothetical protein